MTTLADLFDRDLLNYCLAERLVVARQHPTAALTILNYTERCQYEKGLWNPVTLQCRGLIHDTDDRIVARPFRKFFNYGQEDGIQLAPDAPVRVTDKLDGSLGILYPVGDGYAIATRGAFESEQAQHATALLRARYPGYAPPDGWTDLFEIVYPENRIVLDYGTQDDLIFLGSVQIATGVTAGPHVGEWPGPRATVFDFATLAEAVSAPPRPNAEGLVIHCLTTHERVKIKQADYVALHRIVTGLNERTVWEHLRDGKPLPELLDALPDEFHEWVGEVAARLLATVEADASEVERAYSTILANLPAGYTRKDFALVAKEHPQRAALFQRHDGKEYRGGLWDAAKPSPRMGPRGIAPTEATA